MTAQLKFESTHDAPDTSRLLFEKFGRQRDLALPATDALIHTGTLSLKTGCEKFSAGSTNAVLQASNALYEVAARGAPQQTLNQDAIEK